MTAPALSTARTWTWTTRLTRRVELHVTPGALLLAVTYVMVGVLASMVVETLRALEVGGVHTGSGAVYSAAVVALVVAGTVAHEAGHAVAGHVTGHQLQRVRIGTNPSVHLEGTPYGWRRLLISVAGPGSTLLYGSTLLWAAGGWAGALTGPVGTAGAFCVITATLGFLPTGPNSDGRKILRGLGQIIAGTWQRLR